MERRRKKRGEKLVRKLETRGAGHLLSHCCGVNDRESESAKRELGDQRQTDSDRDGEVEKRWKNEGDRYVKRDSSVFGGVLVCSSGANFISLIFISMLPSKHYPHVILFISVLSSSSFCVLSHTKNHCS